MRLSVKGVVKGVEENFVFEDAYLEIDTATNEIDFYAKDEDGDSGIILSITSGGIRFYDVSGGTWPVEEKTGYFKILTDDE